MRYTVFGATGGTGRQLVRQAVALGHRVTAVVRDPDRLPVRHELLEVATADVRDTEALRPLVAGRDAALSALGSNNGDGIAPEGTRALLRALETEHVPRALVVSAAPVGPPPPGEGLFFRAVLDPVVRRAFRRSYVDLTAMEAAVEASSVGWTVLRPPRLTDGPGTGDWQLQEGGAVPRRHRVTRADLAAAMLAMAVDDSTARKVYGIAN